MDAMMQDGTSVDRRHPETASMLDQPLSLATVPWQAVAWISAIGVAIALRFAQLDVWALAPDEAKRAYDAWSIQLGNPPQPGQSVADTSPVFLLSQGLSFFLFGATDVVARLVPVLFGVAIVVQALAFRPVVGAAASLGMAMVAAFSPTLVYASRTNSPEIAVAALTLFLLLAIVRAGERRQGAARTWGIVAGMTLGALLASGPSSITAVLSLAGGLALATALGSGGAMRGGLSALLATPGALLGAIAALLGTVLILFTRCFSELGAIAGVGHTFADWGRLLAEGQRGSPVQLFLLAVLLYEPLVLALGLVAAIRGRVNRGDGLGWPLFGGWFAVALVVWSLSSGRQPIHAVHVALPLVFLGGGVLGDVIATLNRRETLKGRHGLLLLVLLGLFTGIVAVAVLASEIGEATARYTALSDQLRTPEVIQTLLVIMVVVIPLAYAAFHLATDAIGAGGRRQTYALIVLALALPLAALTFRSTIALNFYNAGEGNELLAQRTMTSAVRANIDGLQRLSRDETLFDGSIRDPTGGHGLTIAVERAVQWPFQWYFRDFPDFSVVDTGQAHLSDAQVVFAAEETNLAEAGYSVRTVPYRHRVPSSYASPDSGELLSDLVHPDRWFDVFRFVLFRDGLVVAEPIDVSIGLGGDLAARVFPASGPYALSDRPGPGSARGQFNQPIGIAVASTGTVYIVDMVNARIQRFSPAGDFVGIWGKGGSGDVAFSTTANGLGPTGIATGADGLVYVADTWGHRIAVIRDDGNVVREFGGHADTGDDPAAVESSPGLFFGPRAVAVSTDEIFVSDTGNERIQVFGIDGTFKRAWGGYGTEPNRLIEPVGITVGPDGLIYVADSGNARISIFTPAGDPVEQWPVAAWPGMGADGSRPANQPYLAFGADGVLYATSSTTGSVEVFAPDGTPGTPIHDVNGDVLQEPIGIATAADGTILITDINRDSVFRLTPPPAGSTGPPAGEPPNQAAPNSAPISQPLPRPPGATEPARG